jgi:hypothetical protein
MAADDEGASIGNVGVFTALYSGFGLLVFGVLPASMSGGSI